jgi:hypothetical protein
LGAKHHAQLAETGNNFGRRPLTAIEVEALLQLKSYNREAA